MKKYMFILTVVAIVSWSFIITGCGEVKQQIANENLAGTYSGNITYVFRGSQLNIGIGDEQTSEKCVIIVFNTEKGVDMQTPDGNIKVTGIKLLVNGVSFNIPEQRVNNKQKQVFSILGNSMFIDTEGYKSDGQYNDTDNRLQFSYNGTFTTNEYGMTIDLPFEAFFEGYKN